MAKMNDLSSLLPLDLPLAAFVKGIAMECAAGHVHEGYERIVMQNALYVCFPIFRGNRLNLASSRTVAEEYAWQAMSQSSI
jgi:hypothetical protein